MTRWNSAAVLAVSLLAPYATQAALKPPLPAVTTQLSVNGVACGTVTNWQGGDMRLTVQHMEVGNDSQQFMNAARRAVCTPVSFEIPFPAPKPVMDMIQDVFNGGAARSTLVLRDVPAGSTAPAQALEISNAFLIEVRFPAFVTAAREAPIVTLVFQGDSSRNLDTSLLPPNPTEGSRRTVVGSMRLEIPGIDAEGLTRLEPFSFSRPAIQGSSGPDSSSLLYVPGQPSLSHLFGTVALENSSSFVDWRNLAVSSSSLSPRDATLTLLDPGLKPIVVLHLTSLGMIGVGVVPNKSAALRKMQVELSCEHLTLEIPEPPPATPPVRRSVSAGQPGPSLVASK
jgi:hypothetical protein